MIVAESVDLPLPGIPVTQKICLVLEGCGDNHSSICEEFHTSAFGMKNLALTLHQSEYQHAPSWRSCLASEATLTCMCVLCSDMVGELLFDD
jgi:hypothetical protein